MSALYICHIVSAKFLEPDTTILWYVTVMVGMRLVSVFIILKAIDYDE
jgi:hypothetical protein